MKIFLTFLKGLLLCCCVYGAGLSSALSSGLGSELTLAQSTDIKNNAVEAALSISDAWIAEAPPTSKVMVAYLNFNNHSAEDIIIVSAESTTYSSIEFHETIQKNGLARMIRHDRIFIRANSSKQLKRGGKHLMLFNPNKALKAGDMISIVFTTNNQKILTTNIFVKKATF